MAISNQNYAIINNLSERTAVDVRDVWAVADYIIAPTLAFRIAQIFSFIFYYLPSSWTRWYVDEAKTILDAYRTRFYCEARDEVRSDSKADRIFHNLWYQNSLTSRLVPFMETRQLIQRQKNIQAAKQELFREGWQADARLVDIVSDTIYAGKCEVNERWFLQATCFAFQNNLDKAKQQLSLAGYIAADLDTACNTAYSAEYLECVTKSRSTAEGLLESEYRKLRQAHQKEQMALQAFNGSFKMLGEMHLDLRKLADPTTLVISDSGITKDTPCPIGLMTPKERQEDYFNRTPSRPDFVAVLLDEPLPSGKSMVHLFDGETLRKCLSDQFINPLNRQPVRKVAYYISTPFHVDYQYIGSETDEARYDLLVGSYMELFQPEIEPEAQQEARLYILENQKSEDAFLYWMELFLRDAGDDEKLVEQLSDFICKTELDGGRRFKHYARRSKEHAWRSIKKFVTRAADLFASNPYALCALANGISAGLSYYREYEDVRSCPMWQAAKELYEKALSLQQDHLAADFGLGNLLKMATRYDDYCRRLQRERAEREALFANPYMQRAPNLFRIDKRALLNPHARRRAAVHNRIRI